MPSSARGGDLSLPAIAAALQAAGCVFAYQEAQLLASSAQDPGALREMVARRAAGLPLEHVLGWAEFCGLRVGVDPGVFVPRRRSEFLVRRAAGLLRGAGRPEPGSPGAIVVDLACGCGAIGAGIATLTGGVDLHACDIDEAAVRCARRNLASLGGHAYVGDLYQPLPAALRGRTAVIAANVPYVPTGSVALMPAEARLHEPRAALDGGPDGLDVLRRAAAGAADWLAPGGHLLIEIGRGQAAGAMAAFADAGLSATVAADDDLDATIVIGHRRTL